MALPMDNFSPAFCMHLNTDRMFSVSCSAELAAIPISSTLRTLVGFNNGVKVFSNETGNCGEGPT